MPPSADAFVLLHFTLGYAAILLVPGPNMLAVGSTAALYGLRAALPLVAGIACGALLLAAFLLLALGTALAQLPAGFASFAAALLLAGIAADIARRPMPLPPADAAPPSRRATARFALGCGVALGNPVTAAFLAAQAILMAEAPAPDVVWLVIPSVPLMAGAVMLLVALLLSRPRVRHLAQQRQRTVRLGAAAALGTLAVLVVLG
jgi:threonine/homoserine/homoserine lactone efflux protein